MKKKSIGFALIIAAFVSVTSGCYVGYEYGHPYRNRYEKNYHDIDHRGYQDHDRYNSDHRDHDNRGY